MRQLLILFILLLVTSIGYAQEWNGDVKWRYYQDDNIPDTLSEYRDFVKSSDTTILDMHCITLNEYYLILNNNDTFPRGSHTICIEDRKWFYFNKQDEVMYDLYDFSLEKGDTMTSYCPYIGAVINTGIDSVSFRDVDGENRKVLHMGTGRDLQVCNFLDVLVEGIGPLYYLFSTYGAVDPPQGGSLVCYWEREGILYSTWADGCDFISKVAVEREIGIKLYPNPVTDELRIELNTEFEATLLTIDGQVVKRTKSNTMSMGDLKPGVYILLVRVGNVVETMRIVK